MNMQTIQNVADLVLLYQPLNLYLKPLANLTVTITFPTQDVSAGKAISNFDVMDKLRQMILPDNFSLLKVSKTTLEYIRFEAELDDRTKLKNVTARLDGRKVKLAGFSEYSQVKASESRCDFPTRHDWDSFFRDARNMDEMKAGERPDTIYLSHLPIKWFCPRHQENDDNVKPSESLFKRIFERFGEVRVVDIPICDPYRNQMKSGLTGLKNFSFDNDMYFEGYVQFTEYGSFVRAMDDFRGMKLVRKDVDKLVAVNIQVTFDKTKHLSDASVKRRKVIRDRLIEKDREKAEEEEKKLRAEQELKEKERQKEEARKQILLDKQRQREERRKQKYMQKITQEESSELTKKIRKEQKKLLKAQRKVESIRLLEALFERIKTKYSAEDTSGPSKGFQGFDLRSKLNKKKKDTPIDPNNIKKERSLSATSISSNDSILSDSNTNKASKKKKKKRSNSSSSSSSSDSSSSESNNERKKKPSATAPSVNPNGVYPGWMNHPETGEWIPAPSYVYPPPFYPGMVRPYYNPNYRGGGGGYMSRPRGRGRGRGRYYNNYESDGRYKRRYDDDDDYYNEHDNRRTSRRRHSRSYSRSRSRSRSHRRRHRSYSRSSSRSSRRSHSRKARSRSKSRSTSRPYKRSSRSTSRPKLVTTLRDGDTNKVPPSTRRNRSRSGSGWSSDGYRKSGRSRRTWSRENSPKDKTPEQERPKTAKEIQLHVQQKLKEQEAAKEQKMKELEGETNGNDSDRKRSASVDSSKFQSPKRTLKSMTPDLVADV